MRSSWWKSLEGLELIQLQSELERRYNYFFLKQNKKCRNASPPPLSQSITQCNFTIFELLYINILSYVCG